MARGEIRRRGEAGSTREALRLDNAVRDERGERRREHGERGGSARSQGERLAASARASEAARLRFPCTPFVLHACGRCGRRVVESVALARATGRSSRRWKTRRPLTSVASSAARARPRPSGASRGALRPRRLPARRRRVGGVLHEDMEPRRAEVFRGIPTPLRRARSRARQPAPTS